MIRRCSTEWSSLIITLTSLDGLKPSTKVVRRWQGCDDSLGRYGGLVQKSRASRLWIRPLTRSPVARRLTAVPES